MLDTENSNSGTETEESDDSLLDLEIEFQNQIPHPATMVHLGKKAIWMKKKGITVNGFK